MRAIIEPLALVLCSLVFAAPSLSGPAGAANDQCLSKEAIMAQLQNEVPGVVAKDVTGDSETNFLANVSRGLQRNMNGFDVVLFHAPGSNETFVVFFRNGCVAVHTTIPNVAMPSLFAPV